MPLGAHKAALFGIAGVSGDSVVLLTTQTAAVGSEVATMEFTSKITSAYSSYIFKFIDIHPENDRMNFRWQCNAVGGSGWNENMTSTGWRGYHAYADNEALMQNLNAEDQDNDTDHQTLVGDVGGNDANANVAKACAGELQIFNPADTTYAKHYISRVNTWGYGYLQESFFSGYIDTTSAIDEFQFRLYNVSGGGEDFAGTIKMYGVK